MAERNSRKQERRRARAGLVLYAVCTVIILVCFVVGGIQFLQARGEAKQQAKEEAAAQAAQEEQQRQQEAENARLEAAKYDFTIAFMGDVNLADGWDTMYYMSKQANGIRDCIGESMLEKMQAADLFCVNSEFAFTSRGTPLDGKSYTFRSDPSNISIYQAMGVDVVTLANNHIYDYGAEGLTDTLAVFDRVNIGYVGAGENIEEASAPYYAEIQGQTIAFVNASNAEVYRHTPEATEESSGILLCYEPDKFLQSIREAKQNADYVVACVHWGTDYTYETSDEQRELGQDMITAGADIVVGTHSHCLQGIEYYNGKPIFYGLGSCWFNNKTLETFMLELHFEGNALNGGTVTTSIAPALQTGCTIRLTESETEWNRVTDLILQYSDNVYITADGLVGEGEAPAEDTAPSEGETAEGETPVEGETSAEGEAPAEETSDEAGTQDAQG